METDSKIVREVLSVAAESDLFILGEWIGSREIPQLATELLDPLWGLGYRTLAIELQAFEVGALVAWATGKRALPPISFAHPFPDGRSSEQTLHFYREAVRRGWRLLAIDSTVVRPLWGDRLEMAQQYEGAMADSLLEQWDPETSGSRLFCFVGSVHSRLSPTTLRRRLAWPSFAAEVKRRRPNLRVESVAIRFHGGSFYNNGIRRVRSLPLVAPRFSHRGYFGHPYCLHLNTATPATFAGSFIQGPYTAGGAKQPRLARELRSLFVTEQQEWERLRGEMSADEFRTQSSRKMEPVFRRNTERLRELIERYGWPTISLVGPEAADRASHIAFESGHDRRFQLECLRYLEQAVADGEATPGALARLEDLLLLEEGRPQRYGTQLEHRDGVLVPKPVEEEETLDERREALGLPPLEDYLRWMEALRSRGAG